LIGKTFEVKKLVKEKRKILLLLKTPPPFGGGELRAKALKDYVSNMEDFIVLEFSSRRLNKSTQGKFEFWKIIDFVIKFFSFLWMLGNRRPALVFLHLPKSFVAFIRDSFFFWAIYFFKIPCVAEFAGMKLYFLDGNKIEQLYGRLVLSKIKCIRVLGKDVENNFKSFGIKNTIVSDNGVLIQKEIKYCANRKDGVVRLLFVGTHSPQKGFDNLLKAFKFLIEKEYLIELHTIGEWVSSEFEHKMKKLLELYKIKNRVVIHGCKYDKQKWEVFSESQMLVLPSLREGQPLVILEALGCGIPVVATRVGAIPETIENGKNGYLISPGAVDQLSESLESLILDAGLRLKMSKENLRLFQRRFTLEKYLLNQVNWLRSCII